MLLKWHKEELTNYSHLEVSHSAAWDFREEAIFDKRRGVVLIGWRRR